MAMIRVDLGHGYTGGAWEWALDTFGAFGASADRWSYGGNNVYYFRDEADATLFLLKWL
jgi:hypothetical protein